MKRTIYIGFLLLLNIGFSHAQKKSTNEIKGDASYFRYDYEDAIQSYHKADLTAQGLRNYATALEKFGQTVEAEKQFSKLLIITDHINMEDHLHYANLLKVNGKFHEYFESMDLFANLYPLDSRSISYQKHKGDFDKLAMDNKQMKIQLLNMNTSHSEFATSFWKEQLVYSSNQLNPKMFRYLDKRTSEPFLNVYVADVKNNQLVNPRMFNRDFKNAMNDGTPSFSKNGTFMAYTRNHLKDRSEDKIVELQIHFSTFLNDKWSEPIPFEYNYSSYSVGQPFLTESGDSMYFTSNMPGGFGGKDLYLSTWSDAGYWTKPRNLGHEVNTESDEMFPFYDEQTKILYFSSDGHFGLGGLDLFYYSDDEVVNLGAPINSRKDDFALILKKDGINGFYSSNRSTGKGSDDIYSVQLPKIIKREYRIEGIAVNVNNEPLSDVLVCLFNQKNELIQSINSPDGSYQFSVNIGQIYTLKGTKSLYNEGSNNVSVSKTDSVLTRNVVLSLIPMEKTLNPLISVNTDLAKVILLNPIYFDFDQSLINQDASVLLDEIVRILNEHPMMEVSLRSYTDCRGPDAYNQYLSDLRAMESLTYIQQRISNPNRVFGKGYGESNPLNDCACLDQVMSSCTSKEHEQNRRTEFIVVRM